jgi:hypothetical protein
VTGTDFNAVDSASLSQRQLHSGRNYPITSYYNGHIVKRRAGLKNRLEQFRRNPGIDSNACFYKFTQRHPPLNNN